MIRTTSRLLALLLGVAASIASAGVIFEPRVRLLAEERYDDGGMLLAGIGREGQLMTKLSPQLGVLARDRTMQLELRYSPDLMVRHGSGSVGVDHRATLIGRKAFSTRTLISTDLRLYRVSDTLAVPRLGLAHSFDPVVYGTGELVALHRFTRRWTGVLAYRVEGARVLGGDHPLGLAHAPAAEAWLQMGRRLDFGLEYRFQYFAFAQNSAHAHGVAAAARYRLSSHTTVTLRGGPVSYLPHRGGEGGLLPRAALELVRRDRRLELGLALGHDLAGASGAEAAIWTDYLSLTATYRLASRLTAFGAGSYYRNGAAPAEDINPFTASRLAHGYGVGGGLEWRVGRHLALRGTLDRYAQSGSLVGQGPLELVRTVAAVRLELTAW